MQTQILVLSTNTLKLLLRGGHEHMLEENRDRQLVEWKPKAGMKEELTGTRLGSQRGQTVMALNSKMSLFREDKQIDL